MTQLPFAINQALNLACVATTWADYAAFWDWKQVPLDARVRYCQGGSIPAKFNANTFKNQANNDDQI